MIYWSAFTILEWVSIYIASTVFLIGRISFFLFLYISGVDGSLKAYETFEKIGLHKLEDLTDRVIGWIKNKFEINQ